ncbi:17841_t:CDS:2, partial [Racocetra fulgida]
MPISQVVKKGCDFLISKQKEDGGWGESYKLIVSRQLPTGEWKTEYVDGIINNMAVTYSAYKFIFPIWALG